MTIQDTDVPSTTEPGSNADRVAVVVLHYRNWPEITYTLKSVLGQTMVPGCRLIVDNDSGPELCDRMHTAFPDFRLMPAGRNLGYAAGMNIGIDVARSEGCEFVLLLTHECLLGRDAVEILVRYLIDHPTAGAVGPLLGSLREPLSTWSAGGYVRQTDRAPFHLRQGEPLQEIALSEPQEVAWLDGAAVLLRSAAVEDVGGLDQRFFLYFEDVEYGTRLCARGWKVVCVPQAIGWQRPGRIDTLQWEQNQVEFARMHRGVRNVARLLRSNLRLVPAAFRRGQAPSSRTEARNRLRSAALYLMRRYPRPER